MTKVGIKEFRKNLSKYMKQLPIAVENRGQTVAIVVSTTFFDYLVNPDGIDGPDSGTKGVDETGFGGGHPAESENPTGSGQGPGA